MGKSRVVFRAVSENERGGVHVGHLADNRDFRAAHFFERGLYLFGGERLHFGGIGRQNDDALRGSVFDEIDGGGKRRDERITWDSGEQKTSEEGEQERDWFHKFSEGQGISEGHGAEVLRIVEQEFVIGTPHSAGFNPATNNELSLP